jgi:hypothetical protein
MAQMVGLVSRWGGCPEQGIRTPGHLSLGLTGCGESVHSTGLSHCGLGAGDPAGVSKTVSVRGIHGAGCQRSTTWGYPNEEPIT